MIINLLRFALICYVLRREEYSLMYVVQTPLEIERTGRDSMDAEKEGTMPII